VCRSRAEGCQLERLQRSAPVRFRSPGSARAFAEDFTIDGGVFGEKTTVPSNFFLELT
jgi:hypothetical protein